MIPTVAEQIASLEARRCPRCYGRGRRLRGMGEVGDWDRCSACGGTGDRSRRPGDGPVVGPMLSTYLKTLASVRMLAKKAATCNVPPISVGVIIE